MAQFVYIDETGSDGSGGRSSPLLMLVAVLVPEQTLRNLSTEVGRICSTFAGASPSQVELHGHELWNRIGVWREVPHAECIRAYESAIGLLPRLEIQVAHSSVRKSALTGVQQNLRGRKSYLLGLQFLLEKIDALPGDEPRLVFADRAKAFEVAAVEMFSDIQWTGIGEVPGRKHSRITDSLHYVDSKYSPGVQLADLVAFVLQRRIRQSEKHPAAEAAMDRMHSLILSQRVTWRETWPSAWVHV